MEKISWLDEVTNEEFFRRVKEDRQIQNYLAKETSKAMFWDMMDFHMITEAEWEVNQQEAGEEFKCDVMWQMMAAVLHANGHQRTEKDGDGENDKNNRKMLMMSASLVTVMINSN